MNFSEVIQAIRSWDQIRAADMALSYLTSGYGFEITRTDFDRWEAINNALSNGSSIQDIHVYLGIHDFQLTFFLVDSHTDEEATNYQIGTNLLIKPFTKPIYSGDLGSHNIPPVPEYQKKSLTKAAATSRLLRWMFYSDIWFKVKQDQDPDKIVRGLTLPYGDVKALFEDAQVDKNYVFFGLHDFDLNQESWTDIELIIGPGDIHLGQAKFEDVSLPCPPFSLIDQKFNLINNY